MVITESYFDNLSLVQPYCVEQLSIFYKYFTTLWPWWFYTVSKSSTLHL